MKNTVISNSKQAILFLGFTAKGSVHDFKLLKEEFPVEKQWFKHLKVWIDLGYIGFSKHYETKELHIPYKKPYKTKNNPNPQLSPEKKEHNRVVSQVRVKVENAIGGTKRYGALVQIFRNKSEWLLDQIIFIAAGLWNFSKGFNFNT